MSMSLQSYTFFEQRRSVLLAVLNEEQHRHIKASLGKIDFKKIAGEVDNGQELKKKKTLILSKGIVIDLHEIKLLLVNLIASIISLVIPVNSIKFNITRTV